MVFQSRVSMVERTTTLNNNHIINHTADKPVIEIQYFGCKSFFEKRITCTSPSKTHPSIQTKTMHILYTWMFPKIGVPPNHPILIWFSDHFGVPLFLETPTYNSIFKNAKTNGIYQQPNNQANQLHPYLSINQICLVLARNNLPKSVSNFFSTWSFLNFFQALQGFLRASWTP